MARPKWQVQDNETLYDIYDLVLWMLNTVSLVPANRSVRCIQPEKDEAPKDVKDNWSNWNKIPAIFPLANGHFDITTDNDGTSIQLAEIWILGYITWNEVKDAYPSDGIKIGIINYDLSRAENMFYDARYMTMSRESWSTLFSFRFKTITGNVKMTRWSFFYTLDAIGAQLYNLHPTNPAVKYVESYIDKLEAWIKKTESIQRILNIVQTYITLDFLSGIGETLPILEPIADTAGKIKDNIFSAEKLIDLGLEVISDTIKDYLMGVRKDILNDLQTIDDNTILNLSSVTESVSQSTRDIVDSVEGIINDTYDYLRESINSYGNAIDTALTDPISQERTELDKSNLNTGLGFALGIKRLLFRSKVK